MYQQWTRLSHEGTNLSSWINEIIHKFQHLDRIERIEKIININYRSILDAFNLFFTNLEVETYKENLKTIYLRQ